MSSAQELWHLLCANAPQFQAHQKLQQTSSGLPSYVSCCKGAKILQAACRSKDTLLARSKACGSAQTSHEEGEELKRFSLNESFDSVSDCVSCLHAIAGMLIEVCAAPCRPLLLPAQDAEPPGGAPVERCVCGGAGRAGRPSRIHPGEPLFLGPEHGAECYVRCTCMQLLRMQL